MIENINQPPPNTLARCPKCRKVLASSGKWGIPPACFTPKPGWSFRDQVCPECFEVRSMVQRWREFKERVHPNATADQNQQLNIAFFAGAFSFYAATLEFGALSDDRAFAELTKIAKEIEERMRAAGFVAQQRN